MSKTTTETSLRSIRSEFPYLDAHPQLAFLDSAASSQKPRSVIECIARYYSEQHANIHRGVYRLSQEATQAYDEARAHIARFIGAQANEIVFVRGATEGFNLLAQSFLKPALDEGDEIVISILEHHANIVPWQLVCKERGAKIRALPLTNDFRVDVAALKGMLTKRTKLLSLTHISNALGSITDIEQAISIAKEAGVPVVIDGAQAVSHFSVDVAALGCDFYVFSGHKLYGPTGIGVLYGRKELLEKMPPYQGGGDMIELVTIEESTFAKAPERFEAGTPHIAGAVGLSAAIRFVEDVGFSTIVPHEQELQYFAEDALSRVPGIRTYGSPANRVGAISFTADWGHPHDIGTILDKHQVAVRSGHHCAQPLMRALGVSSTTRISFGVYTVAEEIEQLIRGLEYARKLLS